MYCSRCGQQLPARVSKCPACDTPQKLKHRQRRKLLLGLFLFLAGAFVGSLVDGWYFQGGSWGHSLVKPWVQRAPTPSGSTSGTDLPTVHPGDEPLPTVSAVAPAVTFKPPVGRPTSGGKTKEPGRPLATEPAVAVTPISTASSASKVDLLQVPTPDSTLGSASAAEAPATPVVASLSQSSPDAATIPVPGISPVTEGYELVFKTVDALEEGDGTNYHGSLSGDAPYLLFSSNRVQKEGKPIFQTFVRDLSGKAGPVRVFDWPGNVWTPEFSRDGSLLVFTSDSEKKEHVFLFDRKTQVTRQLTTGGSKNQMAAFSPDARFVAFTSDRSGNNDIWMVGADGQGLVQVTRNSEDEREPRWSPDGRTLYYTRIIDRLKISHIMKIELDPLGKPETVIGENGRNWMPDLSPDGRFLAYVHSQNADGSGNVLQVRRLSDGKELSISPFTGGEHFRPIWSADGQSLVFHAERKGRKSLFAAHLQRK